MGVNTSMKLQGRAASKIIRRTHMYLALFLTPWLAMYALSTMAMNHRHFFEEFYKGSISKFKPERSVEYASSFSDGMDRDAKARQILRDLDMEGAYYLQGGPKNKQLAIMRLGAFAPTRLVYHPETKTIAVEEGEVRLPWLLAQMHGRRGYGSPYLKDDIWGLSVEVTFFSIIFWVLSGLWLWWEMKPTRVMGTVFLGTGTILFLFFLARL